MNHFSAIGLRSNPSPPDRICAYEKNWRKIKVKEIRE